MSTTGQDAGPEAEEQPAHPGDHSRPAAARQPECGEAAAQDFELMGHALAAAQAAAELGEVPVGAVVVHDGKIIATAHNRREMDHDPLAHAEILAIRAAAAHLGRWRLTGCTLLVTLEPCPMCAGAIVNARLDRVVFAAHDPRAGAAGSIMDVVQDARLNHRAALSHGVRAAESADLLRNFFAARRLRARRSGLSS